MKVIISAVGICIAIVIAWFFVVFAPKADAPNNINTETNETLESADIVLIIAFGDSLTAGYGLLLDEAYPSILEGRLKKQGYAVKVINAGVSGETTAGSLARSQFIRDQNPDIVLLGIGGNDALRGLPVSEVEKNIRKTLNILVGGIDPPAILLLKMQAPVNTGIAYKKAFDSIYIEISKELGIQLVPFIVEEVARNPKLLQIDGIHPTKRGYEILVDTYILPSIVTEIENRR